MKLFVTGTDTNIGKTIVSSWLCLHLQSAYFKPIQSGTGEGLDSERVNSLSGQYTFPEQYLLKAPISPHFAAKREGIEIDLSTIKLPDSQRLIVEGAGGVFVPINDRKLMIDLIKQLNLPALVIASTRLGTINHTLLTINALKLAQLNTLGIVLVGEDPELAQTLTFYSGVPVLAQLPIFKTLDNASLSAYKLSQSFRTLLERV